nr:carboxypeptidase-like regulatory domain-containing protein [Maribacter sp. Hal144]
MLYESAANLPFFFSFFCSGYVSAQLQYNGTVKDIETNNPLPYVNIGVLNKGVGTVTDEDGRFALPINRNRISLTDTLQISSVGYQTIKKAIGDLNFSFTDGDVILMRPEVYQLNEIVLSQGSESIRQKKVGYYYERSKKIGYWRGITSLGAEMATKIRVNRRPRQLNEFYFHVLKNVSDSLLLRVNVYRGDTPYPEVKLSKRNIIFTLKKKQGKVTFDLTPYEIYVDDDFTIGLELLEVYGKSIGLTLSASDDPGTSYRRYASQDEWKRFRNDAMTFELNTTIYEKDDAIAGTEDDVRITQNQDFRSINASNISGFVFNNGTPWRM